MSRWFILLLILPFTACLNYLNDPKAFLEAPDSFSYSISNSTVYLSWKDKSGDESAYKIYMSTIDEKPYTPLAELAANSESYIYDNYRFNERLYLWVEAWSPESKALSPSLEVYQAGPDAITSSEHSFDSNANTLTISWDAPNNAVLIDGYNLFISTNLSSTGEMILLPSGSLSYTIDNIDTNVNYYIRLQPYTEHGTAREILISQVFVSPDKSYKRGIGYGYHSVADMEAISEGVSWWYNWAVTPESAVENVYAGMDMEFIPMTWNGNSSSEDAIRNYLDEHPEVKYLLGYNEPNFSDQANLTPTYAAQRWPAFESIAEDYSLKLVGPAMNFCGHCVAGLEGDGSPTNWMTQFLNEYEAIHEREAKMDYVAIHWYDYGFEYYVNLMADTYNKPVWVTEFALWRADVDAAAVEEKMLEWLDFLENNEKVYRYSWFTGRTQHNPDIALFGADGELTSLGEAYINAPF